MASEGVGQRTSSKETTYSAKRLGALAIVVVAIIVAAGYVGAKRDVPPTQSWGIIAAALLLLLAMLGVQVHGRVSGALIDDRNLMSLARFQLAAWTVLLVSAYLAMALDRAFKVGDTVAIPSEVWQLFGLASASAVGRELIVGLKKAHRLGSAHRNPTAADASIVDMFQGDEVGNSAHIDISKVQMFFFTIAALVVYASDVFAQMETNETALPAVGSGMLAILSVSHAAYLGNKALDHTREPE